MEDDLNLSDTQYALAVNLFQVSYIICSVPSNMILSRMRPSIYIPVIMFLWGVVVAAKGAMTSPSHHPGPYPAPHLITPRFNPLSWSLPNPLSVSCHHLPLAPSGFKSELSR